MLNITRQCWNQQFKYPHHDTRRTVITTIMSLQIGTSVNCQQMEHVRIFSVMNETSHTRKIASYQLLITFDSSRMDKEMYCCVV